MPQLHRERNHTLDGLRGFAALLVVLRHLSGFLVAPHLLPDSLMPLENTLGRIGSGSVCLFFMISGYLILQSLLRLGNISRFLQNRAIRIYPVFLVLHLLYFTLGPLAGYEWMGALRHAPLLWLRRFLENLLFLPGVFALPIAQKNAWSLSYEAAFYGVASIGFVAWCQAKKAKTQVLSCFGTICWGGLFAFLIAWFAVYHPRTLFFEAGVLAYFTQALRLRATWGRWMGETVPLWLGLMFITLDSSPWVSALMGMIGFVLLSREWGSFATLLRHPCFQWLGRISYSLYLVHPVALAVIRAIVSHFGPRLLSVSPYAPLAVMVLAGLPLSLLLAHLSYRLIEVWFTNRFLRRARTPVVGTPSSPLPAAN